MPIKPNAQCTLQAAQLKLKTAHFQLKTAQGSVMEDRDKCIYNTNNSCFGDFLGGLAILQCKYIP